MDGIANEGLERHLEVKKWLEGIFGEGTVPPYEINHTTLDILYQIKERYRHSQHEMEVMAKYYRAREQEYRQEADRLASICSQLGVTPDRLTPLGKSALHNLVSVAVTLNLRDTSKGSCLLGVSNLTVATMGVENELREATSAANDAHTALSSANQLLKTRRKTLSTLEDKADENQVMINTREKEAEFYWDKVKEYERDIQALQEQLYQCGYEDSISHSSLCALGSELDAVRGGTAPMQTLINSYHNLPPDVPLAKVRLEEARQKLRAIEDEMQRLDLDTYITTG